MFAMFNLGLLYCAFIGFIAFFLGYLVSEIIRAFAGVRHEEMFAVEVLVVLAMCWVVRWFEKKLEFFPTFKRVRNAPVSTVILMTLTNVIGPGSIILPVALTATTGSTDFLLLHWAWLLTLPVAFVLFLLCMAKWRKLEP